MDYGCTAQRSFTIQEVSNLLVIQDNINCLTGAVYDLEFTVSGGNYALGDYVVDAGSYTVDITRRRQIYISGHRH